MAKAEAKKDPYAPIGPVAIETLKSAHDRIAETARRNK